MKDNIIEIEKCVGCGLCTSLLDADMRINDYGFNRPYINKNYDKKKLNEVCPVDSTLSQYSNSIWGDYYSVYYGYSTNNEIRERGSSGGVITQILVYLLESNKVDAVIHIGIDDENPLITKVKLSETIEQIIENSGSRYAPASPLMNIDKYLEGG